MIEIILFLVFLLVAVWLIYTRFRQETEETETEEARRTLTFPAIPALSFLTAKLPSVKKAVGWTVAVVIALAVLATIGMLSSDVSTIKVDTFSVDGLKDSKAEFHNAQTGDGYLTIASGGWVKWTYSLPPLYKNEMTVIMRQLELLPDSKLTIAVKDIGKAQGYRSAIFVVEHFKNGKWKVSKWFPGCCQSPDGSDHLEELGGFDEDEEDLILSSSKIDRISLGIGDIGTDFTIVDATNKSHEHCGVAHPFLENFLAEVDSDKYEVTISYQGPEDLKITSTKIKKGFEKGPLFTGMR